MHILECLDLTFFPFSFLNLKNLTLAVECRNLLDVKKREGVGQNHVLVTESE